MTLYLIATITLFVTVFIVLLILGISEIVEVEIVIHFIPPSFKIRIKKKNKKTKRKNT